MKLLVTGGRKYQDIEHVFTVLDLIRRSLGIDAIVHGGATGADSFAKEWARLNGIPEKEYRPNYGKYAPWIAPKMRNQEMLDAEKPNAVAAFPGKGGTQDMTIRARCAGVPVLPCHDIHLLELRLQWFGINIAEGYEDDGGESEL